MTTTRIHHWQRHYRVLEPHVGAWESLARGPVLAAFEAALRGRVGDSREVILLRRVRLRFTANARAYSPAELADHWGRAMAQAVHETVQRNDAEVVRRFADPEEHLVCFLETLCTHGDSAAWYFAKFHKGRPAHTGETLDAVLSSHVDLWPEVMARLTRRGLLPAVLRQASPETHLLLWSAGIRGIEPHLSPETQRPFFSAALQIFAHLCQRPIQPAEAQAAFHAYVAQPQPATDWNDPTHLAEAVYAAIRFLAQHFADVTAAGTQIAEAVQPFDWLDREWLQRRLLARFEPAGEQRRPGGGPRAPASHPDDPAARLDAGDLTPRQAEWTEVWNREQRRFFQDWNPAEPASPHNRLLALSLLVQKHPDWVHDPAVAVFVERLLAHMAAAPAACAEAASAGTAATIAAGTLGPLSRLPGTAGKERVGEGPVAADGERALATEFAGVFLLLRAIHDLRLLSLSGQLRFPSADDVAPARLLLELACRWTRRAVGCQADAGLLALARLAAPAEWRDLQAAGVPPEPAAVTQFQSQLARTLLGQGTWATPARLRVAMTLTAAGECCLLGGDSSGALYPWSALIAGREQAGDVVAGWRSQLAAWTGESVELLVDEELAGAYGDLGGRVVPPERTGAGWLWRPDPPGYGDGLLDATLAATANVVVRHWARWIRGLGGSSTEFLLQQMVRREGTIRVKPRRIDVALPDKPLDVALRISGMLEPLDLITGVGMTTITFRH